MAKIFRALSRFLMTTVFLLAAGAAHAESGTQDRLTQMFAWWNEAIKSEDALTEDAFSKYFTEDAVIRVNDREAVRGVANMVPHFRRIHSNLDYVEIVLPFETEFQTGEKIFTHHIIKAREKGAADTEVTSVMGYALMKGDKIDFINFLSVPLPDYSE
ncbi:MAG: hypothetical protein KDD85_13225 [Parvularculaceae bacterium]|nr:hypothetical protein [Parvularculaceae bacterium]